MQFCQVFSHDKFSSYIIHLQILCISQETSIFEKHETSCYRSIWNYSDYNATRATVVLLFSRISVSLKDMIVLVLPY